MRRIASEQGGKARDCGSRKPAEGNIDFYGLESLTITSKSCLSIIRQEL